MIRWYYAHPKTRQQTGPCDEATVRALYVDGTLAPSTLVWHEGLAEWIPARTAFGASPSAAPAGEAALPPRLTGWLLFDGWMFLLATLCFLPFSIPFLIAALGLFRVRTVLLRMGGTSADHLPLLRAVRHAAAAAGWGWILFLLAVAALSLVYCAGVFATASPDAFPAALRSLVSAPPAAP
jgi:hypothetical protein